MKCFNIRFRKFGRGARGRVDCESCRSCQPRLLKIALVYVLLGWTAESPAAAHVALTGCPALLRTLVFAASMAFTCTLCVRRRLAGFQNEFGVHFNFAGIPGRDHAPGLCTLRDLSALQPAMDLASWLALMRSRSPHSTTQRLAWFPQVDFRHIFAYAGSAMAFGIQERKQFVVTCKRCRRDIPAGVKVFPFQSIVIACPLCGEQRRYLPSEVLLGRPNHLVEKQAQTGAP